MSGGVWIWLAAAAVGGCCLTGGLLMRPRPELDPSAIVKQSDLKPGYYAVVQDLRPIGYRVSSQHATLAKARRVAARSSYWKVETTEWVIRENDRLADPDEFLRSAEAANRIGSDAWKFHSQSVRDEDGK